MASTKHVLLTGSPGVGKTTLCRNVWEALKEKGIQVQGFYTEEVRSSQSRSRVGFDVVTLDGRRGPLARTKGDRQNARARSSPSVGNYTVDLKSFEELALPTIILKAQTVQDSANDSKTVVIVDEVGKMELFSGYFISSVRELFSSPNATVLAAVPVTRQRAIPFVNELKTREDVTLIEVTRATRDTLLDDVVKRLIDSFRNT